MRALLLLLLAAPVFAQSYSVTPTRGSSDGGTEVTIRGSFRWLEVPYRVRFGFTEVPVLGGSNQHLLVRTPPHLPGELPITIFEGQTPISTGVSFTYEGVSEEFERILLPVFVNLEGAFGSRFRSDFTATLLRGEKVELFGFHNVCRIACIFPDPGDAPYELTRVDPDVLPWELEVTGTPGLFLYVRRGTADDVAMNLRAYDTSRAAQNFGTEVPIVREDDFVVDPSEPLVLVGIPSDARFRRMLRIYSTRETNVAVTISAGDVTRAHFVTLRPGATIYEPAYAELGDFPVDAGELQVRITSSSPFLTPPAPYAVWAFVSVTNNETQHITTITPQP